MTNTEFTSVDEQKLVFQLGSIAKDMQGEPREIALDFSSVSRLSSKDVIAIEAFVRTAEDKKVKVTLRGVNVPIYKSLKLVKLARRFSFVH